MPTISMFYGIIIRMFTEPDTPHHVPHIHVVYAENQAVFSLTGELLEGSMPNKQRKMVEGWIAIHEDELNADWSLLQSGEPFFKINPLQ